MKVTYTERNGRRYAYTCTSRRVPGKRNPVSEKVYLGVVDPETGEIIPKRGSDTDGTRLSGGYEVKGLGDVALVTAAAERLGIPDSLRSAFGEDYLDILALVVAQAVRPSPMDSAHMTFATSYICESLGLDPSVASRRWVRGTMERINRGDVEGFVGSRIPEGTQRLFIHCVRMSLTDSSSDPLFDLPEMSRRLTVCVAVLMTPDGSVAGFDFIPDPVGDTSGIVGIVRELESGSIRPTLILGPTEGPYVNLPELLREGVDVISVFPVYSDQYIRASTHLDLDTDSRRGAGRHERICLHETDAGISMASDVPLIFMPGDPGFGSCGSYLRAYMVLDTDMSREARRVMDDVVRSIRLRLDGKVSEDPERSLRDVAGPLEPLFRISTGDGGAMRVSVRRDMMSGFRRNSGMIMILSTTADLAVVKGALSFRRDVDEAVRQFFGDSHWAFRYGERGGRDMYAHMFVEFVVAMIYRKIIERSLETGGGTDVAELLFRASMLKMVVTPTGSYPSSTDKRLLGFLSKMGVDNPVPVDRDANQ